MKITSTVKQFGKESPAIEHEIPDYDPIHHIFAGNPKLKAITYTFIDDSTFTMERVVE